jgi:hypothetical protein
VIMHPSWADVSLARGGRAPRGPVSPCLAPRPVGVLGRRRSSSLAAGTRGETGSAR